MIGRIVQSNTQSIDAIFDTLRNLSIEKKEGDDDDEPPSAIFVDSGEEAETTILCRLKIEVDFLDLLELLCTTVFDNNDGSANVVVATARTNKRRIAMCLDIGFDIFIVFLLLGCCQRYFLNPWFVPPGPFHVYSNSR